MSELASMPIRCSGVIRVQCWRWKLSEVHTIEESQGEFNVPMQYQGALVKALNRLTEQGTLQRLSKGKYYKPRKTIFGTLKPVPEEITKDFLEKNGKLVGYITGNSAFASMGLTTQITSSILIGTNRYRNPLTRGDYVISFLQQRNPITEENFPLLRILDALKFIKEIPASSPDSIVVQLGNIICTLSKAEQKGWWNWRRTTRHTSERFWGLSWNRTTLIQNP